MHSIHAGRRSRLFVLAAGLAIAASACASITPIGDLNANANKYDGKTVRIAGTVKSGAGGLGVGEYQVSDNTGTLTVVSASGNPPQSGSNVTVKGIFQALITLGNRGVSVLKEQSRSN